jgi:hypothetical protein
MDLLAVDTIPHSTCSAAPAMITPSAVTPTTVMLTITITAKASAGIASIQLPRAPLYFPNLRVFELLRLLPILALGLRWSNARRERIVLTGYSM